MARGLYLLDGIGDGVLSNSVVSREGEQVGNEFRYKDTLFRDCLCRIGEK